MIKVIAKMWYFCVYFWSLSDTNRDYLGYDTNFSNPLLYNPPSLRSGGLNNTPLGYSFGRESTNTPILKILTPNMLRHGRLNSRSLDGPIRMPKGPKEMMSKVEELYESFFKLWNVVCIPRLLQQVKWFKSSPEIKVDDVIYFQKVDNVLSQKWSIGQVDSVVRSKDGVIRRVTVRYHNAGESFPRFTERSVRSLVRLFNVEDTYFVHDLEMTEKMIETLEENDEDNDKVPPPLRLVTCKHKL